MRVSVANGAAMRGVTFDLSGLKTALADAQTCLQAVPTAPMPKSIKAAPPPLPTRTPDAIAENLDGDMPDVTTGASIPPLDWPDLEGDAVATKTQSEDKMNTEPSGAVFSDVPVDMPVKDQWDVQIGQAPAVPVSVSAAPVVAPMPAPVFAPAPIQQDVSLKPRAHKIVVSGPPVDQPAPMQFGATGQISAPVPETQPLDTYRARKGESLRDVLRRWSDRAHVDLVWTMASDIILQHDFSHVGDFQPAVAGLLAQYPQSGIKTTLAEQGTAPLEHQPFVEEARAPMVAPQPVTAPDLQDFTPNPPPVVDRARGPLMPYASVLDGAVASSPGPSVVVPPPVSSLPMKAGASVAPRVEPTAPIVPTVPTVAAPPSSPPPSVGPVRRWRALTGASVRQVVQAWAEDAGLPVLWMGNDDFAVRASVNKTSDFGGAVATLFGQYGRDPVRPMGQIYRDPQTGQSTLVVRIVK